MEVAGSFVLLQEAYDLDIAALARGDISSRDGQVFHSQYSPDWLELSELGTAAANRGWMDSAITWYQLALEEHKKSRGTMSPTNDDTGQKILFAYVQGSQGVVFRFLQRNLRSEYTNLWTKSV